MTVVAKWEQMRQKMEDDMTPVKPESKEPFGGKTVH